MDKIYEFYKLAEEYCAFIQKQEIVPESIEDLMRLLMKLYISAMDLPEIQPDDDDIPETNEKPTEIRLSEQVPRFYFEVFDPYTKEEPVCLDLIDDLCDIAFDLRKGSKEYEAGRKGNAVFEWRFGLNNHWGSHAVDILRALHAIRVDYKNSINGITDM